MSALHRLGGSILLAAVLGLTGCASPTRLATNANAEAPSNYWQGRFSLHIDSAPPQVFSASFELSGQPQTGTLLVNSPLGNTLAELHWTPGNATLRAAGELHHFPSLEALLLHTTGAPLPVTSLFAWLKGESASAPGWRADLSRVDAGRLTAQRTTPKPVIDLNLVFQR